MAVVDNRKNPRRMNTRWRRQFSSKLAAAFTLIEVLVVVAIITILAGILLPSLARAKSKGYAATCMNNEHQLGLAMHTYGTDNDDKVPYALMRPRASVQWTWDDLISSYLGVPLSQAQMDSQASSNAPAAPRPFRQMP